MVLLRTLRVQCVVALVLLQVVTLQGMKVLLLLLLLLAELLFNPVMHFPARLSDLDAIRQWSPTCITFVRQDGSRLTDPLYEQPCSRNFR